MTGQNFSEVVKLRKKYPCMTLQAIGKERGITRERARQILEKAGLSTASTMHCLSCGTELDARHRSGYCPKCYNIPVVCAQCGKLFYRRPSDVIRGSKNAADYCSMKCSGKHHGKLYGFKSKITTLRVRHLLRLGFTPKEIGQFTRLSLPLIYSVRQYYFRVPNPASSS